ncbi:MAG: HAMP domain-containing protein, partial [Armatimonadetes bacterium]|nr:HAMP domain-containing protein [Armatimonadota bacterium]
MADRKRAFIPLRTRLAIAYVALAVVVSALLTAALLLAFRAQLRRDLERNLTRLVAVAATTIDGDLHGTLRTRQDEGSPTYARLKRELQQVRKACGGEAAYVYTMRATAEGEFIFVVDAETDPALVSHLGDVYDDASPWLREHGPRLAEPTVEPGLNTDAWGTWMSAFAPLHTSRGAVDGVIGIDIPAASVMRAERRVWLISLLAFLATLPLAAGLGWWLGRRLSRPVVSLREAAVALAEGDFSQRAQCERGDEIGDLGRA